jgi:hypothetical protein
LARRRIVLAKRGEWSRGLLALDVEWLVRRAACRRGGFAPEHDARRRGRFRPVTPMKDNAAALGSGLSLIDASRIS